ncbi:hypothetical protein MPSEU_001080800 [Mayamaea pseudoterrestris]|nr:hypothetical protein MPSEU_001080800 [Mayamaea pseudoterrestris]
MASLDMLLESLNEEDKKTRRVPDRTMSGDTLDSIKNHRRSSYKAPPGAGLATRTSMSRRGSRRPPANGKGGLGSFVESMNESQKSLQEGEVDIEEETVDSRQLTADKLPKLKASARKGKRPTGRAIAEVDEDDEDDDE